MQHVFFAEGLEARPTRHEKELKYNAGGHTARRLRYRQTLRASLFIEARAAIVARVASGGSMPPARVCSGFLVCEQFLVQERGNEGECGRSGRWGGEE
eukprot:scaffold30613_cov70-Phaeocystis_antarctica.AAC.1